MNIDLHIERLVLDGVALPPGAAGPMGAALEAELQRLLTERGIASGLARGGAIVRVSAPEADLTAARDPAGIGRAVAKAIHGGLTS